MFLSESAEEESEIAFGGIDQSRMASDLFWIDVSKGPGYWEIKIDDFAIGGKKLGICEGCRVAIDTGTSELAGPTSVVDSLLSVLSIHKNCSNFDDLPNIGVHVGGHILGLARHDYVNQDVSYSITRLFAKMAVPRALMVCRDVCHNSRSYESGRIPWDADALAELMTQITVTLCAV